MTEEQGMPCILCYMQKTNENEQIKDDLHWFPAYVCSEHVLKNLANLSLIMIVHIKMILMGKKPMCMYVSLKLGKYRYHSLYWQDS